MAELKREVDSLAKSNEFISRELSELRQKHDELAAEHARILRLNLRHIVPVREPLVLISQIQRSGGTLLSQLLDNHKQCHAHPYELQIGYPEKFNWPDLTGARSAEEIFQLLQEKHVTRYFHGGYYKHPNARTDVNDRSSFSLVPSLQKLIFVEQMRCQDAPNEREILNAYMTSYFNAWLDNNNLEGEKKYVTAFVPRLHMYQDNVKRFFSAYPDGVLVSIVREPSSWYVSAHTQRPKLYQKIEDSITQWKHSTEAVIAAKELYAESVYVMSFGKLVAETETTTRRLSEFLGITFSQSLLEPTFNGKPIKANSVFPVSDYGVISEPLERHRGHLTQSEVKYIERETKDLFDRVSELCN